MIMFDKDIPVNQKEVNIIICTSCFGTGTDLLSNLCQTCNGTGRLVESIITQKIIKPFDHKLFTNKNIKIKFE